MGLVVELDRGEGATPTDGIPLRSAQETTELNTQAIDFDFEDYHAHHKSGHHGEHDVVHRHFSSKDRSVELSPSFIDRFLHDHPMQHCSRSKFKHMLTPYIYHMANDNDLTIDDSKMRRRERENVRPQPMKSSETTRTSIF
jgi:hypothetical protein